MAAPLASHRKARDWIRQFRPENRATAESFLNQLRLVPFVEFEESIASLIDGICVETKGLVAVFPIDRDLEGDSRRPSSAARIGYMLTNLERINPRRVRVMPTQASMLNDKVKHIVLVDDLCGSGKRLEDFWDAWATRSVKSWLSYGVCELWVVAFAVHENGVERALERITYLDRLHVRSTLQLPAVAHYPSEAIYRLCDEYGKCTVKSRASRGFGGSMSPVIFQHGCPNNVPAILWAAGRNWRPLFPSRGIPPELYECFGDTEEGTRNAEILWDAGQYKLALEIINAAQFGRKSRRQQLLLTILGLLSRRVAPARFSGLLTVAEARIESSLDRAKKLGLVDRNNGLTSFGRDLLARARLSRRDQDHTVTATPSAVTGYYPYQYFGVQRNP